MIKYVLTLLFMASFAMAELEPTPVQVVGGTLAISSIPATSGTAAVSVVSLPPISGTLALSAGASTSANQTVIIASLGTISSALAGTLNVVTPTISSTQTIAALAIGTISVSIGDGVKALNLHIYDPDDSIGDVYLSSDKQIGFYGSIDNIAWFSVTCSDTLLFDGQLPVDTVGSSGQFECPVSGLSTFQLRYGAPATERATISIKSSSQLGVLRQLQSATFVEFNGWPSGAQDTANSKAVSQATDSIFRVMGTVNIDAGASPTGGLTDTELRASPVATALVNGTLNSITNTVVTSGTVQLAASSNNIGDVDVLTMPVVNIYGTTSISNVLTVQGTVQAAGVQVISGTTGVTGGTLGAVQITSPWVTTSVIGTLTNIGSITTLPVITVQGTTQAAGVQVISGTTGITGGTLSVVGVVNTFGTMSITGGTLGVSGVVVTSGTVQMAAGNNNIGDVDVLTMPVVTVQGTINTSSSTVDTFITSGTIALTPAATPNNIIQIKGSATKTVRVRKFLLCPTATAAGHALFFLAKQSTANTGGTAGTLAAVPLDSADAAATGIVQQYTGDPTPGSIVGQRLGIWLYYGITAGTTTTLAGCTDLIQYLSYLDLNSEVFTLRGVAESLSFDKFDQALPSGFAIQTYTIVWTEE